MCSRQFCFVFGKRRLPAWAYCEENLSSSSAKNTNLKCDRLIIESVRIWYLRRWRLHLVEDFFAGWGSSSAPVHATATPATVNLLVEPSLSDRFGAKYRTKGDNLAHQCGDWAWDSDPYLVNTQTSRKSGKRKPWPITGRRCNLSRKRRRTRKFDISNVASQLCPKLLGTKPYESLRDARLVEKFPVFLWKT